VESAYHIPVMLDEIINYLNLAPGKVIVDSTLGTGGHSQTIAERILPNGLLIGIDRDQTTLDIAKERLSKYADNCKFVYGNFKDIDKIFSDIHLSKADGILFDLGISSVQLNDPDRGFSFQFEGPLDMRLDRNSYISAYDLVNNLNEDELSELLWNFGQERWHNRIASSLVKERQKRPISTTSELSNIVVKAIPYKYRHSRIHAATRTFQAVRIAVNRELETLQTAIDKAIVLLNKSARICVISFHSLEDRIVKFSFRNLASKGLVNIITPKPLTPTEAEISKNYLSRSAKLRVAERL